MKPFKWVKDHPIEAAAIAAGVAIGGPAVFAALAPEAAAGAAAGTVAGDAFLPAALYGAGGTVAGDAFLPAAAYGAGGTVAGDAFMPAALGAGGTGESALLASYPGTGEALAADEFAAQQAAMGAGQSALLAPVPTEYGLGGGASGLTGQYAGSAESSLYGPNVGTDPAAALDSRPWYEKMADKFGNKLKDPKTVMQLGMMAAQLGAPHGGPAPMSGPPQMRQAQMTQEDITKKWLMQNDPNTYRRIYGNPQGVA